MKAKTLEGWRRFKARFLKAGIHDYLKAGDFMPKALVFALMNLQPPEKISVSCCHIWENGTAGKGGGSTAIFPC